MNANTPSTGGSFTAFSTDVIIEACKAELNWIKEYRAKQKEEDIQKRMKKTVGSLWWKRTLTREEAEMEWDADLWSPGVDEFAEDETAVRRLLTLCKMTDSTHVNLTANDISRIHAAFIRKP
jgi:hypothetical protein